MLFLTETRKLKSKTQIGDFTKPQQKYAGTGENCNIASAVIFYPGIKTL